MQYDLIVIGTGPGGYVCAIRAAQLGMKVAVVEKRATHGGTCLNVGCIPSKALLHASERFTEAGHDFAGFGIKVKPELDLPAMLAFKDEAVRGNVQGVDFLLKKNKIDAIHGKARIAAPGKVEVTGADGSKQTLEAKNIVIATGSEIARIPGVEIDETRIVSSTGALSLPNVPKRLLVIGAGYIGLELGSVWRRLGSEVTVVEMLDRVAPGLDGEVAKQFQRILTKQGIVFKLGTKVASVDASGTDIKVTLEPVGGGASETANFDVVLVAVGRIPNTEGLGLGELGVRLDNRKRIVVDPHFATNVPGIYAIGDVIDGPMLAHKAEEEGVAVAEILAGQAGHVNYAAIPSVVYTAPEVASVGKTEEELKDGRHCLQGRQVPLHRQWPRQGEPHHRRLRQDSGRRRHRSRARRAYSGRRCRHHDRRSRGADGIRRLGGGSGAHLPRPPDPQRSGERSGSRRGWPRHSHVGQSPH